ncbi:hypothetical protein GDO78_010106 [Eleutherodactylus coqui]|uniref:Uncharacterized protein n=1 Tax=Eleutherodactylus coqui TaxID=57060 RepID=A0A8J6KD85_ELECQ|nr:hypothetical protein GDO78_010106 [Eleutherodactylus coqui]
MAFTFAAFCYMLSLVLCAALIFFAIWHRERLRNIERICFLLRKVSLALLHTSKFILTCCTVGTCSLYIIIYLSSLSVTRYFHCPADSSELAYDPPVVMNASTLSYCQKEAWCKLAFYLLSFFYYLYW